jgi:RNase H-fold protein (predicted Holliday junction resolvase)
MWIGIDYGKKRSGFALSISGGLAATALPVLRAPAGPYVKRESFARVEARLAAILADHAGEPLDGIVLGDPGEDDPGSAYLRQTIRELGARLEALYPGKIFYQDERFSSREAAAGFAAAGGARLPGES